MASSGRPCGLASCLRRSLTSQLLWSPSLFASSRGCRGPPALQWSGHPSSRGPRNTVAAEPGRTPHCQPGLVDLTIEDVLADAGDFHAAVRPVRAHVRGVVEKRARDEGGLGALAGDAGDAD